MNITIDEHLAIKQGLRTEKLLLARLSIERKQEIASLKRELELRDAQTAAIARTRDDGTIQLAACIVAAQGGVAIREKGDAGWSPALEEVLALRVLYDMAQEKLNCVGEILSGVRTELCEDPYEICKLALKVRQLANAKAKARKAR